MATQMPGKANGGATRRVSPARQVAAELAAVLLDTLGLVATIEWHVHQFRKRTGLACELTVKDAAGFELPEAQAATLFEIYHEALSNVARHAGASRVAIDLTITPHEVAMIVRDDGVGIGKPRRAAAERGGLGEIRRRAENYQGVCNVDGARPSGTTLSVRLPLAQAA